MKKALITGIAGQDGSYLAELLLSEGYAVFGLARSGTDLKFVPPGVTVLSADLADAESLRRAVHESVPDEVYNLGGITDLKTAYASPELTMKVNYESVGILLDEARRVNSSVRFLQASSSEVLLPSAEPLNEESPRDWETKNPYARAKMMVDRDFDVRSAILFNHESPRRSEKSVLRKISRGLVRISLGQATMLPLGNLDLSRDWGFAGDYVRAMPRILRQDASRAFVIASGELYTIREVITIVGEVLGTDFRDRVEVDPEFYRPLEQYPKVGDIRRAEAALGWKSAVDFRSLIEMMVLADLAELGG